MLILLTGLLTVYAMCQKMAKWSLTQEQPKYLGKVVQLLTRIFMGVYIGWIIQATGLATLILFRQSEQVLQHVLIWIAFSAQILFSTLSQLPFNLISALWANSTTIPQLLKLENPALQIQYIVIVTVEAGMFVAVCIWQWMHRAGNAKAETLI